MISYRVDYMPDADTLRDDPIVIDIPDGPRARAQAMAKARQISRRRDVSTCYAIARDWSKGRDTGQRVYMHGAFAYQDDVF